MKYLSIEDTDLRVSNIAMGCMRINSLSAKETENLVRTAMEQGINFFDHADIYGGNHACETWFAQSLHMTPSLREKMILQSKCGICQGFYDFSKEHIIDATNESLRRLKTDYLDILLLHRPDTLMNPEEVAEAFTELHQSGKVRYFGVSNHNPMQMEFLQKHLSHKLIINQVQLSLAHTPLIDSGITFNMNVPQSIDRTGEILEYARLKNITLQAWSPFQKGFFEGTFLGDSEHYEKLNAVITRLAKKYGVSPEAISTGWITRHPANIQVILGTTKPQRIIDACKGSQLPLTRAEWYELYQSAGNLIP